MLWYTTSDTKNLHSCYLDYTKITRKKFRDCLDFYEKLDTYFHILYFIFFCTNQPKTFAPPKINSIHNVYPIDVANKMKNDLIIRTTYTGSAGILWTVRPLQCHCTSFHYRCAVCAKTLAASMQYPTLYEMETLLYTRNRKRRRIIEGNIPIAGDVCYYRPQECMCPPVKKLARTAKGSTPPYWNRCAECLCLFPITQRFDRRVQLQLPRTMAPDRHVTPARSQKQSRLEQYWRKQTGTEVPPKIHRRCYPPL